MKEEIITAVDIGSSKIFGIGGIVRNGNIEIIGTEVIYPSDEVVKKGRVVDIEGLSNYLYDLFESIKEQTGERIEWVILGIGGGHLEGSLHHRKITIEPNGRVIDSSDIQNLERGIKNDAIAERETGKKVLQVLPQEYIIDSQSITRKTPVGMHGNTLEVKVHMLTGAVNPIQDIIQCVKNAGVEAEKLFPHSWAVAESTLTEEEKKLGCLVIDLGKGTTDISFYLDRSLITTNSFPIGGGNIDLDLSLGLHTPVHFAEELKKNYGWCNYKTLVQDKNPLLRQKVELFTPSGKLAKEVPVEKISKIVYDRVREILENFVKITIAKNPLFHTIGGGVVISGGSSRLKGILKFSEEIFEQPARVGIPQKIPGLDKTFLKPEFSAGIGLLLLASKEEREKRKTPWWIIVKNKIKSWI